MYLTFLLKMCNLTAMRLVIFQKFSKIILYLISIFVNLSHFAV